ncbi:MAG: hypothetical protein JOY82_06330 [Streptosporangiaceae bacterium]|nr:hypothetical protein [Streptosporangiaceae bacterium]MBV9854127.1 hypothetical protein [Streptosporangiaceae bacterium]
MDRILAAIGVGGRKPEADVSYDPANVSSAPPSSGEDGSGVGRVTGDSGGDTRESGAERRAQANDA